MPRVPPFRFLLALCAPLICVDVGCSSGDLRLAPSGTGGDLGAAPAPANGDAGSAGASSEPLPPPECVEPRCETVECEGDPDCRNECRRQLAACANSCTNDQLCPTTAPFCDMDLAVCTRCVRNEHCLLLYRGKRSVCSDGLCLPCQASSECPEGVTCTSGRCGDCVFDSDCIGGQVCRNYACETP